MGDTVLNAYDEGSWRAGGMRVVALACLLVGVGVGAGVGCSEDVVAGFEFACASSASCGPGYVCNTFKHRCVPASQFAEVTTSGDTEVFDTQVDTGVGDGEPGDSQMPDAEATAGPEATTTSPDSTPSEVSETEVSPPCVLAGGPGCRCQRDVDCAARACIEDIDGPVCATPCETSCPDGRECHHPVAGVVTGFCVAPHAKLCRPCRTHEECDNPEAEQDGGCVESEQPGLGGFCATSCLTRACPAGFRCVPKVIGADPGCVPDEGATCECRDAWAFLGYATGCAEGDCSGTRRCTTSGLGACEDLCDDGLSCTADSCGGTGCSHGITSGTCLIDQLGVASCFEVGAVNPGDPCQVCDASRRTTWTQRAVGSQCGHAGGPGVCDAGGLCVGCNVDNDCPSGHCDQGTKTCSTWPFGADGDLDIAAGVTFTIAIGTHKDYGNVTIHEGGVLRIEGGSAAWTVLGVSGNLVLEGAIDGSAALASTPTGQSTIKAPGPDGAASGEMLSWLPVQARGGTGGGASGMGGTQLAGNGAGGAGGQEVTGASCGTFTPGGAGGAATTARGGAGGTTATGIGGGGGGGVVSGATGADGISGRGGGGGHRGDHGAMLYIKVAGSVSGVGSITLAGQAGGAGGDGLGDAACTCPPVPKAGCPGGGGAGGNGGKLVRRGSAWPPSILVDVSRGSGGAGGANQAGDASGCQCQHAAEPGAAGVDGERDGP